MPRHFPRYAGAEANQPLAVLAQHIHVNPGFIIEAFHFPDGNQFHQVLVTGLVFCQKNQMIHFAPAFQVLFQPGAGSNIHFAANNGFDASLDTFLIELDGPVHNPMVRNRQGGHAQLLGVADQLGNRQDPSSRLYWVWVCKCTNCSAITAPFLQISGAQLPPF